LGRVGAVGKANPVCGSRLADAQIQHHWHWQDGLVLDVARVDERLFGLGRKRRPALDGLLGCDVWADDVDVQVGRDFGRGDGQGRLLVGRRRECRGVVDDDAGGCTELGLDRIEHGYDRLGLGEVGLDREETLVGLGIGSLPGSYSDLVAVGSECLRDGSTDSGAGSEDEDDGRGCHSAVFVDGLGGGLGGGDRGGVGGWF